MKNILCALALMALALASGPASSKSRTIRIEIGGAPLAKPLEITDAAILDRFSIWNGPSVTVNDEPIHMTPENQTARSTSETSSPSSTASRETGFIQRQPGSGSSGR